MSKTFKSDSELAKTISVSRREARILIEIEDPKHLIAINISDNTAPALALAILEAAGVEPVNHSVTGLGKPNWLEGIAHSLKLHIEHEAKATAEAEAQAKLEAEALELFNQYRIATQLEPIDSWDEAHPLAQEQWLAVARKAREIGAKK